MNISPELSRILLLAIPVILIQLVMQVFALIDLARAEAVRGPKWLWVVIIILGEILGPIVYFFVAKREA